MKIFDCFMYSDEKMILDIRLNVLSKYVDYFVIVESKFKHNGDMKEKNFNINHFPKFKNKIIYVYLDKEPQGLKSIESVEDEDKRNKNILHNTYLRENSQRNMINEGLSGADTKDFIIIGDADEIPNLKNIDFDKHKESIVVFKQKMFYYKLNLYYKELNWIGSRACSKKNLISPQWLRNIKNKKYPLWRLDTFFSKKKYNNIHYVEDGGWHFTNIKTPEEIYLKLNTFLHNVDFKISGLNLEDIKKMVNDKKILYDHFADQKKVDRWNSSVVLETLNISVLPEYVIENKNKYKDWIEEYK